MSRERFSPSFLQPILVAMILIALLYGCANKVAPGGGPYDEMPPKLLRSNPENKTLNHKGKKITLYFDEYVKLEDVAKKVIISPPQLKNPKVTAIGKRIVVELEDDLVDSTTYTLDFTDAIVDNNEGNALENFSFAFSTGSEIDTMEVSGKVLSMRDHEPVQGILVGIHPADAGRDAFTDTTFLRMSRTSDRAVFVMRNIKHGAYNIYALKESNGNYRHDMITEGVAFLDTLIRTTSVPAMRNDTVWVDSLTIDTIKQIAYTRFMPDDIVLMYSEPATTRRFISKRERPDSMKLELTFNHSLEKAPVIVPFDSIYLAAHSGDSIAKTPYILDQEENGKVHVFFSDPMWKELQQFEVSYYSVDSLGLPVMVKDSIMLKTKAPERNTQENKNATEANDSIPDKIKSPFTVRVEHKGNGGTIDSILFHTSLPIDSTAFKGIELFNANDTILKPIAIKSIEFLPGRSTVGIIQAELGYNSSYELYFDSLLFTDCYGNHLDKTAVDAFKTKPKDEFSQFEITIKGVSGPMIGELLDMQDKPVRVIKTSNSVMKFTDVTPDKYAFRLIIDRNGNGKWDTGNYQKFIQPEEVHYAPKIFELMKNWVVKETLNPFETRLDLQKPKELIKNKPKEKKKRNLNQEREEDLRRRNRGQNLGNTTGRGNFGGLGGSTRGLQPDTPF